MGNLNIGAVVANLSYKLWRRRMGRRIYDMLGKVAFTEKWGGSGMNEDFYLSKDSLRECEVVQADGAIIKLSVSIIKDFVYPKKFKQGDRVVSSFDKDGKHIGKGLGVSATFLRYISGECDCIIMRDCAPGEEYCAFSWELEYAEET